MIAFKILLTLYMLTWFTFLSTAIILVINDAKGERTKKVFKSSGFILIGMTLIGFIYLTWML